MFLVPNPDAGYCIFVKNDAYPSAMNAVRTVAEFNFSHPLENLRPNYGSDEPEAAFTAAFAQSYSEKIGRAHV